MVDKFPVFRYHLTTSPRGEVWGPYSKFCLDDHIIEETLSDGVPFMESLNEGVNRWTSSQLDYEKPLWRAVIFQSKNGNTALLAQMHHAYTDGQGSVRMLLTLTDAYTQDPTQLQYSTKKENPKKGFMETLYAWILFLLYLPITILTTLLSLITYNIQLLQVTLFSKKCFKTQMAIQKTVAWTSDISLEDVKTVKNHFHATVNDVLVTALVGGIRTYLEDHQQLLENEFLFAIPFSVRKLDDWSLGNKASIVWLFLPANVADPIKLLHIVQSRMNQLKKSPQPAIAYYWTNWVGHFLSGNRVKKFFQWYLGKPHAIMTNVPGPRTKISFGDAAIENYIAIIPQPVDGGLGVAIFSYDEKVSISIATDPGSANPEEIVTSVMNYFNRMKEVTKK